ncbi:hypothetical protein [Cyclobacterium lianum]|nr:hypothetical protein [Cyclobacterium lianum]
MKNPNSHIKIAFRKVQSALMSSWTDLFFSKSVIFIILLIFVQRISIAQELPEPLNNLPDALRQEAKRLTENTEDNWPVHDVRIRIFGSKNLQAIIDEGNKNFNVNRQNKELFLLQSMVRNEKIKLTYIKDGTTNSVEWDPNKVDDERLRLLFFIALIAKNKDLNYQINYDPTTLLIVPPSSILELNISYEHSLIFNNTQLKQERIVQKCLVDADSMITLPVFYESINSNVAPAIRESDSSVWFDAQSNTYKMNAAGLNYHQVEKKITDFYYQRIGEGSQVSDISVRITPEKYFSTLRVNYKRKCYELSYANTSFGKFFADETIRARIRLRKKFIKGIIFSRPNTLGTDPKREARYHPSRNFDEESLYPGDIIYLK